VPNPVPGRGTSCARAALRGAGAPGAMVQIAGLTLRRLLDTVEGTLRRGAIGRMGVPARAYAADAAGRVTVFAFPVPADDAGRAALAAILDAELAKRRAVMCVLALESWMVVGGRDADAPPPKGSLAAHPDRRECVLLDGRVLGAGTGRGEVRVLEVLRRGRRIAALRRLEAAAAQNDAAGTAPETTTAPSSR
jgi:hypothetical protein